MTFFLGITGHSVSKSKIGMGHRACEAGIYFLIFSFFFFMLIIICLLIIHLIRCLIWMAYTATTICSISKEDWFCLFRGKHDTIYTTRRSSWFLIIYSSYTYFGINSDGSAWFLICTSLISQHYLIIYFLGLVLWYTNPCIYWANQKYGIGWREDLCGYSVDWGRHDTWWKIVSLSYLQPSS